MIKHIERTHKQGSKDKFVFLTQTFYRQAEFTATFSFITGTLKVLSSEMDLAEAGSFDRSTFKSEARRFSEKSAPVGAL
jgi:hypothetical protein